MWPSRVNICTNPVIFSLSSLVGVHEIRTPAGDRKVEGLAIGSPLSSTIVKVYMEYFEEKALEYTSLNPRL